MLNQFLLTAFSAIANPQLSNIKHNVNEPYNLHYLA